MSKFRRLTGVKRGTFDRMIRILGRKQINKNKRWQKKQAEYGKSAINGVGIYQGIQYIFPC